MIPHPKPEAVSEPDSIESARASRPVEEPAGDRFPAVPAPAVAGSGRPRVLVVDDDAEMRAYLEEELQEAGYEANSAPSVIDALISLLGGDYDVIVLDWKMPLLDGFELLASATRCSLNVPIIFVSAYSRPEIAFRAIRDGAFAFIPKPFPLSRLLTEIEEALSIAKVSMRPRRQRTVDA